MIFSWAIDRPVHVHIPPQRSAHPNAFDYYMPEGTDPSVDVHAPDWGYALHWAVSRVPQPWPTETPAAETQTPGAPTNVMPPQPVKMREVPIQPGIAYYDEYRLATLAEKKAILGEYQAYLARVRSGFRFRCVVPREPKDDLYFRHFYHASWLLALDGQVKELQGDWGAALRSYLDSLRVGSDVARGAAVCSVHQQEEAVSNAACCVDRVDAACARAGALRVAAILRDQPSYADTVIERKYAVQKEMLGYLEQPDWRQRFAAGFKDLGVEDYDPRWDVLRVHTVSKAAIMARCNYWMDLQISEAQKPFPLDRTPAGTGKPDFLQFFYTSYEPHGTELRKFYEYAHALDGILELALALRAWRLEQGDHPGSLQRLIPTYLDSLPPDPFGLRGTFRYKRTRAGYLLYSIGPDGRDDGGRPLKQIWDYRPTGDIVWGATNAQPPLPRSWISQQPARPIPRKIVAWKSKWDHRISYTTGNATIPAGAAPP